MSEEVSIDSSEAKKAKKLLAQVDEMVASSSALLAELRGWEPPKESENLDLDFQDLDNLTIEQFNNLDSDQPIVLANGLTVLGKVSLGETTIAGGLMVDASLTLGASSINSVIDTLYLQNLSGGGVDILAGKFVIDKDGDVTVEENLTVKGTLAAGSISALEGEDLVINLGQEVRPAKERSTLRPVYPALRDGSDLDRSSSFGRLIIKGLGNKEVASIDASGSAHFAGLNIDADYSATQSGVIIAAEQNLAENGIYAPAIKTNATSGIGVLPAGEMEMVIYNPKVSSKTLVYLTPSSPTQNKVLFVASKKDGEYFKVGIDTPVPFGITFNWWIINNE